MTHAADETGEFSPGDAFGNFCVVRRLGAGAFGEVYEAVNPLGFRVAIKILKRAHATRPDLRARFLREGLSAVKIRHPNAVQVLDTGEVGDVPYLVMEFLHGEDLEALLKRVGHLSPLGAVDIVLPAMAALVAAHEEGVIHRDLKPANVFLAKTRDGDVVPKLVDFGISRLKDGPADGIATHGSAVMGSPAYMSPEQTRGAGQITEASDQFSLGTMLYECVTGRRPFTGRSVPEVLAVIKRAAFPPPRAVRAEIPEDFEAILLRAMALEPAARFPSVRDLGGALLPWASPRVQSNLKRVFDPMGASTAPIPTPRAPARQSTPARHDADAESATTLGPAVSAIAPSDRTMARILGRSPAPMVAAGVAALVFVVGGAVWASRGATALHGDERFEVSVETVPAEASIMVDGQTVGAGRFVGAYARDGRVHHLTVAAAGYDTVASSFMNAAPDGHIVLSRQAEPRSPIEPTTMAQGTRTNAPWVPAAVPGVAPRQTSGARTLSSETGVAQRTHRQPTRPAGERVPVRGPAPPVASSPMPPY